MRQSNSTAHPSHLGNAVQHDMSHVFPPHVQHRLWGQLAVRVGHGGAAGSKKREPHASHARLVLDGTDEADGQKGHAGGVTPGGGGREEN